MRMSGVSFDVPGSEEAAAAYLTAPVERGDVSTTLSATGSLKALVTVQVGSQLSGQIADLLVDFNDEVRQGQPLAKLDPRTFESEVRQAEAAVEMARRSEERRVGKECRCRWTTTHEKRRQQKAREGR